MLKTSSLGGRQSGFTLTELALVLTIGGILLAFFADSLFNLKKDTEQVITQQRIEKISDALKRYAAYNGALPCPANRMLASNAAGVPEDDAATNYGVGNTTCVSGSPRAGTVTTGGVRIGMVPVKTLNLPVEYALDAWGTRFIYAVSENMTTVGAYSFDAPSVIIDGHANNVAYVVVSVGKNYEGGFRSNAHAANNPDLACANTVGADDENCDDDRTFRFVAQNSAPGANFFDDFITFRNLPVPRNEVFPPGAILPFRLSACPKDWTEFVPARGRSVIGTTPAGNNFANGAPIGIRNAYSGETFAMGTNGSSATRMDNGGSTEYFNMPPYIDLLYCEKDPLP